MSGSEIKYGIVPMDVLMSYDGIDCLQAIIDGKLPEPPIARTLGFALSEVEPGRAVFTGTPHEGLLNPLGTVHAGYAATLLDSAMACAVHTALKKGEAYTTLELKLNLIRAITPTTGPLSAEGRLIHRGRSTGVAEGSLRDVAGTLYAHATTTCIIFPATK